VGVGGIDAEDFEPLGLEQLIPGDPIDAGRFQADRVDLVLTQEGRHGSQARRVGRELLNQPGDSFEACRSRVVVHVDTGYNSRNPKRMNVSWRRWFIGRFSLPDFAMHAQ
jgi:hypothetical protein